MSILNAFEDYKWILIVYNDFIRTYSSSLFSFFYVRVCIVLAHSRGLNVTALQMNEFLLVTHPTIDFKWYAEW